MSNMNEYEIQFLLEWIEENECSPGQKKVVLIPRKPGLPAKPEHYEMV